MQHALNKAQDLKIETTIILPIDTIEIKPWSILVKEILLGITKETIQANFEKFGTINKITWSVIGLWQKATIEYKQKESADNATKNWSWPIGKDMVRIVPESNVTNILQERD